MRCSKCGNEVFTYFLGKLELHNGIDGPETVYKELCYCGECLDQILKLNKGELVLMEAEA